MDLQLNNSQYFLTTLTFQPSKSNFEASWPVQLQSGIALRPKKITPHPLALSSITGDSSVWSCQLWVLWSALLNIQQKFYLSFQQFLPLALPYPSFTDIYFNKLQSSVHASLLSSFWLKSFCLNQVIALPKQKRKGLSRSRSIDNFLFDPALFLTVESTGTGIEGRSDWSMSLKATRTLSAFETC